MKYSNIIKAKFISRPNRFISYVSIDGKSEIAHVKNTGRCKELLIPNANVYLEIAENPERKTKYDLITVEKKNTLVNIDSQAPNTVIEEWRLIFSICSPSSKFIQTSGYFATPPGA